jgi:hypothetical protein
MNTKKLILIVLIASIIGGILSLTGYKFLTDDTQYHSIDNSQKARLSSYLADSGSSGT